MRKFWQTTASRRSNVNSLDFLQTLGIECACAQDFCTETCFQEAYFFDWYHAFHSQHDFHGNHAFHQSRFFHAVTNCNSSHQKCREKSNHRETYIALEKSDGWVQGHSPDQLTHAPDLRALESSASVPTQKSQRETPPLKISAHPTDLPGKIRNSVPPNHDALEVHIWALEGEKTITPQDQRNYLTFEHEKTHCPRMQIFHPIVSNRVVKASASVASNVEVRSHNLHATILVPRAHGGLQMWTIFNVVWNFSWNNLI